MRHKWPASIACDVLEVSASGYFTWQRRRGCERAGPSGRHSDGALLAHTCVPFIPRSKVSMAGLACTRNCLPAASGWVKERVRRLMQQHGLKARTKRKFVVTTDSRHHLPVAPDLVQRQFNPDAPNQIWTGDITYLATDEGWVYLADGIDLHSRQLIGWSMQPHMQTSLVRDALAMAWFRRRPPAGAIFHSDRGSQYCSHEFQASLKGWGMRSSMSRKGNCWDSSPTQSFWSRLKTASVHGRKFATRRECMDAVLSWTAFYNHSRLHCGLGYLSPMQF
jgi:putative transposase